jgi:hypothetical protein
MENVGIFYEHLEYFSAIRYNLWPLGIGSLWSSDIFFPVLVCSNREKSGSPGSDGKKTHKMAKTGRQLSDTGKCRNVNMQHIQ